MNNNKILKHLVANSKQNVVYKNIGKFVSDGNNNLSREVHSKIDYMIARRLLAEIAIVPTNERLYDLIQDISIGLFDDISPLENAEENWDEWVERTKEILYAKGIYFKHN